MNFQKWELFLAQPVVYKQRDIEMMSLASVIDSITLLCITVHQRTFVAGIPVRCHYGGDAIFDSESEPCMLTPTNGNFHSIHSHK